MHLGKYEAEIQIEPETRGFRGRVVLEDGGGFNFFGASYDELEREFAVSAREYEAVCRERGRAPVTS